MAGLRAGSCPAGCVPLHCGAFLLTWWLLCFYCSNSPGQPADLLVLGHATVSPLGFTCALFGALFSPISFLQNLAVAMELELLGGSSSLFLSFLFIATHHLGVTLRCRDGVRTGGLPQR